MLSPLRLTAIAVIAITALSSTQSLASIDNALTQPTASVQSYTHVSAYTASEYDEIGSDDEQVEPINSFEASIQSALSANDEVDGGTIEPDVIDEVSEPEVVPDVNQKDNGPVTEPIKDGKDTPTTTPAAVVPKPTTPVVASVKSALSADPTDSDTPLAPATTTKSTPKTKASVMTAVAADDDDTLTPAENQRVAVATGVDSAIKLTAAGLALKNAIITAYIDEQKYSKRKALNDAIHAAATTKLLYSPYLPCGHQKYNAQYVHSYTNEFDFGVAKIYAQLSSQRINAQKVIKAKPPTGDAKLKTLTQQLLATDAAYETQLKSFDKLGGQATWDELLTFTKNLLARLKTKQVCS